MNYIIENTSEETSDIKKDSNAKVHHVLQT